MKTLKIRLFYLVYLSVSVFCFVGSSIFAQKLEANLINLRYDSDSNAVVFDLQIRGVDGYLSGDPVDGQAAGMNLRYDIFAETGVTLDVSSASFYVLPLSPAILTAGGASVIGTLPIYGDSTNVYPLSLNILSDGPGDFGSSYSTIARIVIPVTSVIQPTSATYIRQRSTDAAPSMFRSWWNNLSTVTNGYFTEPADFHLAENSCTFELISNPSDTTQTIDRGDSIIPIQYVGDLDMIGHPVYYLPGGLTWSWSNDTLTIQGTPIVSGTFNYIISGTGPCSDIRETGIIIINQPPTPSGDTTYFICLGDTIVLQALGIEEGDTATYQWGTGNICGNDILPGRTEDTLHVYPTSDIVYWVRRIDLSVCDDTTDCATITIYIKQPPTAPTDIISSEGRILCLGTNTILTAVGGVEGDSLVYQWGTGNVCGANVIPFSETDTIHITANATTTYWVRRLALGVCEDTTDCAEITIVVDMPPTTPDTIISLQGDTICREVVAILQASGGSLGIANNNDGTSGIGSVYQWGIGDLCGVNIIKTGTDDTLHVSPMYDTTYWVRRIATSECDDTTACIMKKITVLKLADPLCDCHDDWERLRGLVEDSVNVPVITIYKRTTDDEDDLANGKLVLCENEDFINSNGTPINVNRAVIVKSVNATDSLITLYTPGGINANQRHFIVNTGGNFTVENMVLDGSLEGSQKLALNDTTPSGGGITANGALTIKNTSIQYCYTDGSGGAIFATNTLTLEDTVVIAGNIADKMGGGIHKEATGDFITSGLDSLLVTGNTAITNLGSGYYESGGGISTLANLTFLPENHVTISYNKVLGGGTGGGIRVSNASLTLTGVTLQNNSANSDGAFTVRGRGKSIDTVIINGTTVISNNFAANEVGGFALHDVTAEISGQVLIKDNEGVNNTGGFTIAGEITGSTADIFGDVKIIGNHTALASGGLLIGSHTLSSSVTEVSIYGNVEIAGNHAGMGGGGITVTVEDGATTLLHIYDNVKISNNVGDLSGGGILGFDRGGNVQIDISGGVEISGDTALYGGGIFVMGVPFTISDSVKLTGNVAAIEGGAIYLLDHTELMVGADVVFSGNTASAAFDLAKEHPQWEYHPDALLIPMGVPGVAITAEDLITLHGTNILTSDFSLHYNYIYNNYDINFVGDTCKILLVTDSSTIAQTVCVGNPIDTILYFTGMSIASIVSTDLPTGVTAVLTNDTLLITGIPTVSGTFNYSITSSNPDCAGAEAAGVITVHARPTAVDTILSSEGDTICREVVAILTASGGNTGTSSVYQWGIGDVCGDNILKTGLDDTLHVSPMYDTTYWVRRIGTSECVDTTACTMRKITVLKLADPLCDCHDDWERLRGLVEDSVNVPVITIYKRTTDDEDDLPNGKLVLCEEEDFINSNGTPINVNRAVIVKSVNATDSLITLYTPGSINANQRHFIVNSGGNFTVENMLLDGSLEGSQKLTLNDTTPSGGGISASGALTLKNATVQYCSTDTSGGAILANNTLTLEETIVIVGNISSCTSDGCGGGGIYKGITGDFITSGLDSLLVSGNTGMGGGGIYTRTPLTLIAATNGITISHNTANGTGGSSGGGGIRTGTSLTLTNVTMQHNSSLTSGGAVTVGGGGKSIDTVIINGTTVISDNFCSIQGGGVHLIDVAAEISGQTLIKDNETPDNAGGIYIGGVGSGSSVVITDDVKIIGNQSGTAGGGLTCGLYDMATSGFTEVRICGNVEISGNNSVQGGGGAVASAEAGVTRLYIYENAKIYGNNGGAGGGGVAIINRGGNTLLDIYGAVEITDNKAMFGGGVASFDGIVHIYDSAVIANDTAGIEGGGIYMYDHSQLTVGADVVFSGNFASAAFDLDKEHPDWEYRHEALFALMGMPGVPITVEDLITLNGTNILTSDFSLPYNYIYNNYDVNFVGDTCKILLVSDSSTIAQTVCVGNPIDTILYFAGLNINSIVSTDLPAGVTALLTNDTLLITGIPTDSGTFHYSITSTNPNCAGTEAAGVLIVHARPTAVDTILSSEGDTVCREIVIVLSASGGSAGTSSVFQWGIGDVCGDNILKTGLDDTLHVSPMYDTTYWVRRIGTSQCDDTTACTMKRLKILPLLDPRCECHDDWERLRALVEDSVDVPVITIYRRSTLEEDDLSIGKMVLCQEEDFINSNGTVIQVERDVKIVSADASVITLYTPDSSYITAADNRHFNVGAMTPVTFEFNNVVVDGSTYAGGIEVSGGGAKTIANAVVQNCRNTGNGGGINAAVPLTLTNARIFKNIAGWDPSGDSIKIDVGSSGGGIYSSAFIRFQGLTHIDSNIAGGDGGGAALFSGAGPLHIADTFCISGNTSLSNGGGLWSSKSTVMTTTLDSLCVRGNKAQQGGGGIYTDYYSLFELIARSVVVSDNIAGEDGGGISAMGPLAFSNARISNNKAGFDFNEQAIPDHRGFGGGVYAHSTLVLIDVVSFEQNIALGEGGGIYFTNEGSDNGHLNFSALTDVTFSNNQANFPYWIEKEDSDYTYLGDRVEDMIDNCETALNPGALTSVIPPFTCAYNNYDINFVGDTCKILLVSDSSTINQTLCIGTPIDTIEYFLGRNINVVNTTNLPNGITATQLHDTLFITGTPDTSGVFNFTVVPQTAACPVTMAAGLITVHARPTAVDTILSSEGDTICREVVTVLLASGGETGTSSVYQWGIGDVCEMNIIKTGLDDTLQVSPMYDTTYWVRRIGTSTCDDTTACTMRKITVLKLLDPRCDCHDDWERLRALVEDSTHVPVITIYKRSTNEEDDLSNGKMVLCEEEDFINSNGTVIQVQRDVKIMAVSAADVITLYTPEMKNGVLSGVTAADNRHFTMNGTTAISFEFDNIIIDGSDFAGGIEATGGSSVKTIGGAIVQHCRNVGNGGGIEAMDALVLRQALVTDNIAGWNASGNSIITNTGNGGGLFVDGAFAMEGTVRIERNQAGNSGGGIYKGATAGFETTDLDSLFIESNYALSNDASQGGGGIYTLTALHFSTGTVTKINRNVASASSGGGLFTNDTLLIHGVIAIDSNRAMNRGGGLFTSAFVEVIEGQLVGNTAVFGGGIYTMGNIKMDDGEIIGNSASSVGGGIYTTENVEIDGGKIDNNLAGNSGGGIYAIGRTLVIGGEINENHAGNSGGGIYSTADAELSGGKISGNSVDNAGGGIYAARSAYIHGGDINGNTALGEGGGIYVFEELVLKGTVTIDSNTAGTSGGGIFKHVDGLFDVADLDTLLLFNNTASDGNGGGIYTETSLLFPATSMLAISNNTASENGGAIFADDTLLFANTTVGNTIDNNTAGMEGGAIYISNPLKLWISNAISFSLNSADHPYWIEKEEIDYIYLSATVAQLLIRCGTEVNYNSLTTIIPPFTCAYNNYDVNFAGDTCRTKLVSDSSLLDQTLCVNTPIDTIMYLLGHDIIAIDTNGLPDGVEVTLNNDTLIVSGTPTVIGSFNYTITPDGVCIAMTITGTITVHERPTAVDTILSSETDTVCVETGTILTATGGTTGTSAVYQWGTGSVCEANILVGRTEDTLHVNPLALGDNTYWVRRIGTSTCTDTTPCTFVTIHILPLIDSRCDCHNDWERLRALVEDSLSVDVITLYWRSSGATEDLSIGDMVLCEEEDHINSNGTVIEVSRDVRIQAYNAAHYVTLYTPEFIDGVASGVTAAANRHFEVKGGDAVNFEFGSVIVDGSHFAGGIAVSGTGTQAVITGARIEHCVASSGGGLISASGTSTELLTSAFIGNTATNNGGAIYADDTLIFKGSIYLDSNTAGIDGGGIYKTATGTFDVSDLGELTIRNNKAEGTGSDHGGAGIYTLADLQFSTTSVVNINHNTTMGGYGGGIYAGDTLVVKGTTAIDSNTALFGGGIYIQSEGYLELTDGVITGNISNENGGGIFGDQGATVKVSNSQIFLNVAEDNGAGIYGGFLSTIEIADNEIRSNTVMHPGGHGGGVFSNGKIIVSGTTTQIVGNVAARGAGINANDTLILQGTMTIDSNTAGFLGGGIYKGDEGIFDVSGLNTLNLRYNSANDVGTGTWGGGGLYTQVPLRFAAGTVLDISHNTALEHGGGIYARDTLMFTNTTIGSTTLANNTADVEGGAIYITDPLKLWISSGVDFSDNMASIPSWLEIGDLADMYLGATVAQLIERCTLNIVQPNSLTSMTPVFTYAYNNYDVNYLEDTCKLNLIADSNTTVQTLCFGDSILPIVYLGGSNMVGQPVTGLPGGVTGTWYNDTLIIVGTPTSSDTFTYEISGAGGCSTKVITGKIIVNPLPVLTIAEGRTYVYVEDTLHFSVNIDGIWESSDTTIATISSLGDLIAIDTGMVTISYTDIHGCIDTVDITVRPMMIYLAKLNNCVSQYEHSLDVLLYDTINACAHNVAVLSIVEGSKTGATVSIDVNNNIIYIPLSPTVTGRDTLKYRVLCDTLDYPGKVYVVLAPCFDFKFDDDCYDEPEAAPWAIRLRSMERIGSGSAIVDYINPMDVPLVGDIYGDSSIKILAAVASDPGAGNNNWISTGVAVFDGMTGEYEKTIIVPAFHTGTGTRAIAQVNGTTKLFIATGGGSNIATNNRIVCYDVATGVQEWISDNSYLPATGRIAANILIGDVNNDGIPDVVAGNKVFNAVTGTMILDMGAVTFGDGAGHLLSTSGGDVGLPYFPALADMDLDGNLEFVAGNNIYRLDIPAGATDATGSSISLQLTAKAAQGGNLDYVGDGATVVADLNNDGILDVIVTRNTGTNPSSGQPYLYAWCGRTGEMLGNALPLYISGAMTPYGTGPSFPVVGDIDGDGKPEICVTTREKIIAVRYNSTTQQLEMITTYATNDVSGIAAPSLFDFNHDSKAELVYRGQSGLQLLSLTGSTFTDLLSGNPAVAGCFSATHNEYPVIADVTGDGRANIIVFGSEDATNANAGRGYVYIYESLPKLKWAPARSVWNQWAYNAVNVNNDLSIPQYQRNVSAMYTGGSCGTVYPHNSFLQQQTMLDGYGCPRWILPDLRWRNQPTLTFDAEGDSVVVSGVIINSGSAAILSPIYVTTYKNSVTGSDIIQLDSIMVDIYPMDTFLLRIVIDSISNYDYITRVIVGLNDKLEDYPYYQECDTTERRELDFIMNRVYGTVFPFIYHEITGTETTEDLLTKNTLNTSFPVRAALYAIPDYITSTNPVGDVLAGPPLFIDTASYYDGSVWYHGIPKYPGTILHSNNPGDSIYWNELFNPSDILPIDATELAAPGDMPEYPIGLFTFKNVPAGDYVLVLFREGYVMRFAEVSIDTLGNFLGHRALVPGDVNHDYEIQADDLDEEALKYATPYTHPAYDPKYDLNSDGRVNSLDVSIIKTFRGFTFRLYKDTRQWLDKY